MSLILLCLIFGRPAGEIFPVEIARTETVFSLQRRIMETKPDSFPDMNPTNLDLWRVCLPFDTLEKELEHVDLSNYLSLSPEHKKLDTFFTNEHDCLHVMIKMSGVESVPASGSTQLLTLNCFNLDETPNLPFQVKIAPDQAIDTLRDLIKKESPYLKDIDPSKITLWKANFPLNNLPNLPSSQSRLRLEAPLSAVFPSQPDITRIHVIVSYLSMGQGTPASSLVPPPSAFKPQIPIAYSIAQARQKFCDKRKTASPSRAGNPQVFIATQSNPDLYIPCNRPDGSASALPLSLLHPIFGKYLDDCKNCVPTPSDVRFSLSFVKAMKDVYATELARRETLLKIFTEHDIDIKPTVINNFTTDGDISFGNFRLLIAEMKNEVGSTGAEPFFQSILYFLEATQDFSPQHVNSVLPCMIVLVFGPYIVFAGAAWTDRPTVQILSPALPAHFQKTDVDIQGMFVRHLGALRRAIHSLDTYYREYRKDPLGPQRNPIHPYPTSFRSGTTTQQFTYLSHMQGHNLFFGRLDVDSTAVCIKFSPHYSQDGHEFLAARGFAPKLYAVERLPGGLYMVIMDDVSEKYTNLFDTIQNKEDSFSDEQRSSLSEEIRRCLGEFHLAGFVHGDIRNTNIMVKRHGFDEVDGSFLLVDYDFCGKAQEVRYPFDLNTTSVWRPEEATGGAIIEAKHDLQMLDWIWN